MRAGGGGTHAGSDRLRGRGERQHGSGDAVQRGADPPRARPRRQRRRGVRHQRQLSRISRGARHAVVAAARGPLPARADRRRRHRELRARLDGAGRLRDLRRRRGRGGDWARPRSRTTTSPGILASAFATYSEGAHLCEIRAGGSRHHPSRCGADANGGHDYQALARFRMDGPAVFHLVARHLDEFVDTLLHGAGLDRDT